MGAGHGGDSGRFGRIKETAMVYAFAIDTLRVDKRKEPIQTKSGGSDSFVVRAAK